MSSASPRSVDSVIIKLSCARIISNDQVDLIVIPFGYVRRYGLCCIKECSWFEDMKKQRKGN